MTHDEVIRWATDRGWHQDRAGHLHRRVGAKTCRIRMSKIAARYEEKTEDGWMRIYSGSLSRFTKRKAYSCDQNVDIKALVCAVAEGLIPVEVVQPNFSVLNMIAKARKELFCVPGCRLKVDDVIWFR